MKTTVDIPDSELEDAIRFTNAKTKREAVVGAIADFNRRMRMAELIKYAGTCDDLITTEELQAQRRGS
ncbi:MAG: type II toxin-antitoxin system VapB family antitoxin [Rhodospirillales bacterium]|nr:type II toxin-antitoxin system VapB family antitoxin [Rhodospirillales bacterium]